MIARATRDGVAAMGAQQMAAAVVALVVSMAAEAHGATPRNVLMITVDGGCYLCMRVCARVCISVSQVLFLSVRVPVSLYARVCMREKRAGWWRLVVKRD